MEAARSGMTEHKETPHKIHKPEDFKLGESVKVLSMNPDRDCSLPARRQGARHRADGDLAFQLPISDLEILEEKPVYLKKTARQTTKGKMKMGKSMSVSPEINLLGKTVDEAVAELGQIPGRRGACPPLLGAHCPRQRHRRPAPGRPRLPAPPEETGEIIPAWRLWRGRRRRYYRRTQIGGL